MKNKSNIKSYTVVWQAPYGINTQMTDTILATDIQDAKDQFILNRIQEQSDPQYPGFETVVDQDYDVLILVDEATRLTSVEMQEIQSKIEDEYYSTCTEEEERDELFETMKYDLERDPELYNMCKAYFDKHKTKSTAKKSTAKKSTARKSTARTGNKIKGRKTK